MATRETIAYSIQFKEFDSKVELWKQYAEILGHVLDANNIMDVEKKRAHLLSYIGPTTYSLLTGLVTPDKLTDKSYDELVKVLSDNVDPQPSEIVERFKFHTRRRRQGESVTSFVAELRRLAKYCNFASLIKEPSPRSDSMHINDENIQRRLLLETATKLTFDKALEIATSMKAARTHIGEILSGCPQPAEVHKVVAAVASQQGVSCYRCGAKGHLGGKCKFKGSKCFLCGKIGHIQ